MSKTICCWALLFAAPLPSQATASDWIAGAGIQQFRAKLKDDTFSSYGVNINTTRWLKSGIGLNLDAAIPLTSDQSNNLNVEVSSTLAAGLTLAGNSALSRGTAAHFTVGASVVNLDVETNLDALSGNYNGMFVKGGLSFQARFNIIFSIDYLHHWLNDDLNLDGFSLSVRREL